MTSREMDRVIAEWMGWEQAPNPIYWYDSPEHTIVKALPRFSSNRNAMAKAEKIVGKLGLEDEYTSELGKIFSIGTDDIELWPQRIWWVFATASAAQRALALVRVIKARRPK